MYKYKILIAGNSGVGKTTLVHRYLKGKFREDFKRTLGVNILIKKGITIKEKEIKLSIWDLGGEERFRQMLRGYSKNTDGVLFLFDLADINTLNEIGEWVSLIRKDSPNVKILLVGAKSDISVRTEGDLKMIEIMKSHYNLFDYIETSSKLGKNVDKCFKILAREIFDQIKLI